MVPNRPSPQDEPAEEVEASSEEEVEASSEEEVDGDEEEESGSESEAPKRAPIPVAEKKPPPKNPDLATVLQSSFPGSEEEVEEVDGEEENESGSESEEPERPKAALAEKKPPPKKPDSSMEENPKTKKPRLKASATTTPAARAGSKRPSESDPKDSKRPKKKIPDSDQEPDHAGQETKKAGGDDSKKLLLLQRIWSDDDEITILEGMIDYYSKQGVHPNADMFAFHDFMKKSLKADVNKTQLQDKIRRLKKKYETNVAKGNKYNPVKPHELRVFDLSKKVWGSSEGLSEHYKCSELRLLEGSLELIGEPKRAGLKEEWKKLHVAELDLIVKRGELAKLILEALR